MPSVRVNVVALAIAFRRRRLAGVVVGAADVARRCRSSCRSSSAWCSCSRRGSPSSGSAAVVLRLGRFVGLRGPGLFWIVPFIDTVSSWIDQRTITTSFAAEQTLTCDTVPVNVDAVLFWMVYDPRRRRSRCRTTRRP